MGFSEGAAGWSRPVKEPAVAHERPTHERLEAPAQARRPPTIAAVEAAGGGTAVEVESSDDRGDNDAEGDDSD